ncbi:hypothetical protein IMSAGC012_02574 [Lachnospiraceae bacterium]|jgi:hypothetical protein|nr:hypothetical protein [Eubacterium sp.]GFI27447.1 hypothetical protein IMSAGC012_02574 [Lachnospiraceae bacterium]
MALYGIRYTYDLHVKTAEGGRRRLTECMIHSESMLLRFDSYERQIAKGEFQTVHFCRPFLFEGLDHLLLLLDDVLDALQFPKQAKEYRYLGTEYENSKCRGPKIGKPDRQVLWGERPQNGTCFRGQMTITVNRREHGSIQGMVNAGGIKTYFRSALELMHMLHFYLEHDFQKYDGNRLEQNAD